MAELPGVWQIAAAGIADPESVVLIERVQQFYVERYGGRDDTPIDPADWSPPRGAFFLGRLDGVAVAMGGWRLRSDVEVFGTRHTAELKRMYVADHLRRMGLAGRMLAHLEETARAGGAEAMILETGSKQPEAITMYRRLGYEDIASFGYYQDAPGNVCLGRSLSMELKEQT